MTEGIEALRARGAARFEPVRFRFIEALARRAAARGPDAGRLLADRLAAALAEYGERFDRAEREARDALASGTARFPGAAEALRQHFEAGEFGALRRRLATLEARGGGSPLAELLAELARHAPEAASPGPADASAVGAEEPRGELKSVRYFRDTWSKLSLDRQLSHAFAQAPENAGPLNSHFLVLQSLRAMRDISPDYLEQFVSYADALLWLEQADSGRAAAHKSAARGERDAGRKAGEPSRKRRAPRSHPD